MNRDTVLPLAIICLARITDAVFERVCRWPPDVFAISSSYFSETGRYINIIPSATRKSDGSTSRSAQSSWIDTIKKEAKTWHDMIEAGSPKNHSPRFVLEHMGECRKLSERLSAAKQRDMRRNFEILDDHFARLMAISD